MTSDDPIRLLALRETPLSVDEVHRAVADDAAGGTVLFVGSVRDHDGPTVEGADRAAVTSLEYSAHPTAEAELRRVAADVVAEFPGCALAATHRLGRLAVGDLAVVVAVSAAHRGEAFAASRRLIDDLKRRVPIWKHQRFADGSEEWVGAGVGCSAPTAPVA
ncbi:molybdenum cofactor biosynthesis protein MoaE [Streptomyces sp. 3MP-14]|uniref:Molybdopterin synthase catalytic subunit 1 n=1 Tax=Streptomyces mimosae TaxID=2586635 RepID=A0A5N6ATC8_9ACTN|nr:MULTISPECIES: molybdenum cofactor biosynthesis protein MoaE [Streptomyces]KAB8171170.1 molybdenum cofactor biosynthesis protein MoaE [Streptomyces mimosae]KAB8179478.1 molybdenum cofactor biosynthesis protein MoaE [Streptomyces sp. 3MP-14]